VQAVAKMAENPACKILWQHALGFGGESRDLRAINFSASRPTGEARRPLQFNRREAAKQWAAR